MAVSRRSFVGVIASVDAEAGAARVQDPPPNRSAGADAGRSRGRRLIAHLPSCGPFSDVHARDDLDARPAFP